MGKHVLPGRDLRIAQCREGVLLGGKPLIIGLVERNDHVEQGADHEDKDRR